jgi:hypothetical protein
MHMVLESPRLRAFGREALGKAGEFRERLSRA